MKITINHKNTTFTHNGEWLYVNSDRVNKVLPGDAVSPSELSAFARGWVARENEPDQEGPDAWQG